MQVLRWVCVLAAAGALAGCGSSESSGNAAAGSGKASGARAANVSATAEEVAEEARGDLDCPARVKSPPRDAKGPVDDVVGVRPGMTFDEAANVVMCTHDLMVVHADNSRGFQLQTYGQTVRQGFSARFAEPRVEKSSRDYMREMSEDFAARSGNAVREDMKAGQSKWYVGTMGLPGAERVISVAREEWFAEGRNPTLASVEQAFAKKYGAPSRVQKASGQIFFTWVHDTFGRLATETSPIMMKCGGSADPDSGVNLSPDCGVVVAAAVYPLRENPALAQFIQVGVVDQAGGYAALTSVEENLQRAETQRQAAQVEAAARNADSPTL
jgi:hypothetical protein